MRALFVEVILVLLILYAQADSIGDVVSWDSTSEREFRGVWIATVANIDWPSSSSASVATQQAELVALFDKFQELNFNAVVLQVRSVADAFYQSTIDPWSVYLTGSQGRAPSPLWDPLSFAVAEAHKRGMELHAWFNPYRARSGSTSKTGLAANHIANQIPEHAHAYGSNLYMDPGSTEVRDRTINTIIDVVRRYDIDAVHFDDYFYPYPVSGVDFPDSATFNAYRASGGTLSLADWRRLNVDTFIQLLAQRIKSEKAWVKFGISPFGIWMSGNPAGVVGSSSYSGQYADSRKWLREGWVDYLAPQLYWKIDPPQQSFTALSDWWIQQNPQHHHLYMGVATYKIADANNWPISEIQRQVQETRARKHQNDLGNIFFSAKYYRSNTHGISDLFKSTIYNHPALIPAMDWIRTSIALPRVPSGVSITSGTISWSSDTQGNVRAYALYRWDEASHAAILTYLFGSDTHSVRVSPGEYWLTAVDRLGRESAAQNIIITSPVIG